MLLISGRGSLDANSDLNTRHLGFCTFSNKAKYKANTRPNNGPTHTSQNNNENELQLSRQLRAGGVFITAKGSNYKCMLGNIVADAGGGDLPHCTTTLSLREAQEHTSGGFSGYRSGSRRRCLLL